MKNSMKIVIPLVIIICTVVVVNIIMKNPPKAKKSDQNKISKISVETQKLKKQAFDLYLESYGLAQASVVTTLTSQVSGKIIFINEKFKNGGYFNKNETLLEIENTDYLADVKIAEASLILAEQNLLEEEAKVKQAKEEWEKFNASVEANSLVLREPQLKSAKANLIASQANYEKTKLNFQRTKIKAPYDGRVIEKKVSIAQVVSNNSELGVIYSDEVIEVRLPLRNSDLKFVDISDENIKNLTVEFYSKIFDATYKGVVVRSESSIDTNTKQLYVISEIQNNTKNLKIGEYLKAKIFVQTLENVLVIPNETIYQGSYVYVEKDGVIRRKEIKISWQDETHTIISKGLEEGENLVLTTLGLVSSGTAVKVTNKNKGTR